MGAGGLCRTVWGRSCCARSQDDWADRGAWGREGLCEQTLFLSCHRGVGVLSLSWFSGLKEALPFQSDELTSGGHERVFPGQRWGSGLVQGAGGSWARSQVTQGMCCHGVLCRAPATCRSLGAPSDLSLASCSILHPWWIWLLFSQTDKFLAVSLSSMNGVVLTSYVGFVCVLPFPLNRRTDAPCLWTHSGSKYQCSMWDSACNLRDSWALRWATDLVSWSLRWEGENKSKQETKLPASWAI